MALTKGQKARVVEAIMHQAGIVAELWDASDARHGMGQEAWRAGQVALLDVFANDHGPPEERAAFDRWIGATTMSTETIAQIQKRTDLDRRGAEIMREQQLAANEIPLCCDDPTPRLHDGKPYCQACDAGLGPIKPSPRLWYVTATEPRPKGCRKDRIHRYAAMAVDEAGAIALTQEEWHRHVDSSWQWQAMAVDGLPVCSLGMVFDRS
jgi:hypothetical protein